MKCSVAGQKALARLAELTDQLRAARAKRQSLPERDKVTELEKAHTEQRDDAARQRIAQRKTWQKIERLKQDIDQMRERRTDTKRELAVVKDSEQRKDLAHDLDSTAHRLTRMEEQLAKQQRTRGLFSEPESEPQISGLAEAKQQLATAEEEMSITIGELTEEIDEARHDIPADVLKEYDQQDAEHGIGAARLNGSVCQACFMDLDPLTMREIRNKPADHIARCPECNVLLITVR